MYEYFWSDKNSKKGFRTPSVSNPYPRITHWLDCTHAQFLCTGQVIMGALRQGVKTAHSGLPDNFIVFHMLKITLSWPEETLLVETAQAWSLTLYSISNHDYKIYPSKEYKSKTMPRTYYDARP